MAGSVAGLNRKCLDRIGMDLIADYQKTKKCPKCENTYFTLDIQWMEEYTKTIFTCDECRWSFVSYTSHANAPGPSSSCQSTTSGQPTQSGS
jgi:hypothetical protein